MTSDSTESKKLKLCVVGATGRTGSLVVSVLPEFSEFSLSAAIVSSKSPSLGQPVPNSTLRYSDDIPTGVSASDVVIDFSTPAATGALITACALHRKPLLIATTGLPAELQRQIDHAAHQIAICVAANTSIGILALTELARHARRILGASFDVEILEVHHKHKKDAPSGTALALEKAVYSSDFATPVRGRSLAPHVREQGEIGVESLRGGDVTGEHTVYFFGAGERIELTHRATDRRIFARGALQIALALALRSAGMHTVKDLLSN